MFADHHHGDPHVAIRAAAPPGVAAELATAGPTRFFVPPYVGHRGRLGLRLDPDELREVVTDAYRAVAPTGLSARLG